MMKLWVIIGIVLVVLGGISWHCAKQDEHIKYSDGRFWAREWTILTGWGYRGISAFWVPAALIDYWVEGRSKAEWWRRQYNENVAGKTVEEAYAYEMANIPARPSYLTPDTNGIIHHPVYGDYPAVVQWKEGMTLYPNQSANIAFVGVIEDSNN